MPNVHSFPVKSIAYRYIDLEFSDKYNENFPIALMAMIFQYYYREEASMQFRFTEIAPYKIGPSMIISTGTYRFKFKVKNISDLNFLFQLNATRQRQKEVLQFNGKNTKQIDHNQYVPPIGNGDDMEIMIDTGSGLVTLYYLIKNVTILGDNPVVCEEKRIGPYKIGEFKKLKGNKEICLFLVLNGSNQEIVWNGYGSTGFDKKVTRK